MVLLSVKRIMALGKGKNMETVQNPMTEYLNLKEAAELLKRKPSTLYHYVRLGKIPYYKPFGSNLYFRKDELLDLMGMNRASSSEEIETEAATDVITRGGK